MADIIGFTPKPKDSEYIWRCECGCLSWTLIGDGSAQCMQCKAAPSNINGSWRKPLPDPSPSDGHAEPKDVELVDMATSGANLSRTLSRATVEETAVVMVFQSHGGISTWGCVEGQEQIDWLDGRIASARKLVVKD